MQKISSMSVLIISEVIPRLCRGTTKGLTYTNAKVTVGDFLDFIVDPGPGGDDCNYT